MGVKTLTACPRLLVLMAVIIHMSLTILLTSIRKVNFKALYKEGWSKTGILPAHICDISFFKINDTACSFHILRKTTLATTRWSHTLKFPPVFLIRVLTPRTSGKFLRSSIDLPSTVVHLNKGLKTAYLCEEESLSRACLSTWQSYPLRVDLLLFFSWEVLGK